MQIKAFVIVNGSKPTRSMLTYSFDKAKVSDLCIFAAAKCLCPPTSTFSVSVKADNGLHYNAAPDVDLAGGWDKWFVTIDPPATDTSTFLLPCASQPCSAPGTLGYSQTTSVSFGDETTYASSSTSTPRSIGFSTPGASTCLDKDDFMAEVSSVLSQTLDDVEKAESPITCLVDVYIGKREEVQKLYDEIKPGEAVMVNKVDVFQFFGTPSRKAALLVLKDPASFTLEILDAAKIICKKALVDLLVEAYPEYTCPPNAVLPATDFLARATANPWFNDLKASDGSHHIVNSFKKRRSRARKSENPGDLSTPAAKRRRVVEYVCGEDFEAAVLAFARCCNPAELKKLVADTAKLRGSWIKKMEDLDAPQIIETFVKKFPVFISDASLIHEDYKFNMIHVRALPVVDFGQIFKDLIPAIFRVAREQRLIPGCTPPPTDSDADALLACNLLIRLVPAYCKRNTNCKPERLFVEAWDMTSINAMHQSRRDIKQTAPMIYVLTNYVSSKKSFFVAADDVALKVPGTFCDALQILMEIHHIFDFAYAKELKPFFELLETLGNVNPSNGYNSLSNLFYDLKSAADALDEENEIAQQNPGDEIAQQNPGDEIAQQNPGDEMARENPGEEESPRKPDVVDLD